MRSISKLFLLGLAALMVCAAVASAASATTVHSGSTTGPIYSGSVTGTQNGSSSLTSSWAGTITCTGSTLSGSVNGSTGAGSISSATWSGCTSSLGSCTVTANALPWSTSLPTASEFDVSNPSVTIKCGFLSCTYAQSVIKGNVTNPGDVNFPGVPLSGNCGTGTWTADYTLTGSGGVALYAV